MRTAGFTLTSSRMRAISIRGMTTHRAGSSDTQRPGGAARMNATHPGRSFPGRLGMDCRESYQERTPYTGGRSQVLNTPTPAGRSRGCLTGEVGGKGLDFYRTIVRRRLAALIACCLIHLAAGRSGHRRAGDSGGQWRGDHRGSPAGGADRPGWDAEVSYEIADGSFVTVWDVAQAPGRQPLVPGRWRLRPRRCSHQRCPTGRRVSVLSGCRSRGRSRGMGRARRSRWVDPATGEWVEPAATTEEWVEPVAEGWVDPATGEWVEPAAPPRSGSIPLLRLTQRSTRKQLRMR